MPGSTPPWTTATTRRPGSSRTRTCWTMRCSASARGVRRWGRSATAGRSRRSLRGPCGEPRYRPAPPGAPPRRARLRDPFRWIIETPGPVDAIVFGGAAFLVLVFSLGAGASGWWTLYSVAMIAAGALCRVRPLAGVGVIGALAVLHMLMMIPVILGDAMTFYAMFCAVAYGRPLVHGIGVAAGMLGVLAQALFWSIDAFVSPYGGLVPAATSFVILMVIGTITIVAVWALANLQRARVRQLALIRDRAE